MKIGIISDSHDNIWKLDQAMEPLQSADVVLHCGDLIAPFIIKRLKAGLGDRPVHIVWGNNDGDKRLLTQFAQEAETITIHGDIATLELGGKRVAINHYPEVGRALAESGGYDLVCCGHSHTKNEERIGETLLINPGEIMGMNGPSTLAIYDTEGGSVQWVEIPDKG